MVELFRGVIGNYADILARLGLLDFVVITVNIVLMIFARRIIELIYHDNVSTNRSLNRVHVFRALNLLINLSIQD
ncbi:MAG: hypothetical protein ABW107_21450, partial [Candidatus Thiodiazotropha sp. 6PLUC5]